MYTVIWLDSALDKLTELYVAASRAEQDRMASGIDALNHRLFEGPLDVPDRIGVPLRV